MADNILREEGLPPTTPRYQYQGIKHCLECFEHEFDRYIRDGQPANSSYIIFDHVDERSFLKCFEDDSGESLVTHSLVTYYFTSLTVVAKMPTPMHGAAQHTFSEIFCLWHNAQESRLLPAGSTTVEGSTRKKTPGTSWKSSIKPPKRDSRWPTIVVEVGWSETKAKLKQDIRFWFCESNQQVNVALTIKVTEKGNITIDKWGLNTNTGDVEPVQTMSIYRKRRARRTSPNQYHISGSIDIPFQDCFLRAKRGNETDFRLSHDNLKSIAEVVWEYRS
ncbi:hypothetical protein N7501_001201 [Penicillium viridicatum]|nr:hypothetical protein N7501_001201 [Penicillium viridicatum]